MNDTQYLEKKGIVVNCKYIKINFFTDADGGKWTSLPVWAEALIIALSILSGYLILLLLVIRHLATKKSEVIRSNERTAIDDLETALTADRGRMFVKIISLF